MNEQIKRHDVIMRERGHLEISGVSNVLSFDEESVCLETVLGEMVIEGMDMKVSSLDTDKGNIYLDGTVNGIYYNTDNGEAKKGFFKRFIG